LIRSQRTDSRQQKHRADKRGKAITVLTKNKSRSDMRPLQDCEIAMVATYAPEGVTDDDVAVIVRKVEQMHGLRHNAVAHRLPEGQSGGAEGYAGEEHGL